jgi:multicomponent Na+:H+ antiporter subunit C
LSHLPFLVVAVLLLGGMYGIATSRNYIHLVMCLAVMQASTYILLLTVGYKLRANAPIYADTTVRAKATDPVTHALTLTDIVVGTTVSGLLLAMAVQVHKEKGTLDPAELRPLRK